MQQRAATLEGTLRDLRIFHGALLASIAAYGILVWWIPVQDSAQLDSTILASLVVGSALIIAVGFVVRAKFVRPAMETLTTIPDDLNSLIRWRKGTIICCALAESVALYGVMIHFIGGSILDAILFMSAGAVMMLSWMPRRP